ncbi:hypothetical protein H4W33_003669 [Kibdelosporangium phytohabitans]|nr:hypothetical protein [Kibdelosporangium phytohabitans]
MSLAGSRPRGRSGWPVSFVSTAPAPGVCPSMRGRSCPTTCPEETTDCQEARRACAVRCFREADLLTDRGWRSPGRRAGAPPKPTPVLAQKPKRPSALAREPLRDGLPADALAAVGLVCLLVGLPLWDGLRCAHADSAGYSGTGSPDRHRCTHYPPGQLQRANLCPLRSPPAVPAVCGMLLGKPAAIACPPPTTCGSRVPPGVALDTQHPCMRRRSAAPCTWAQRPVPECDAAPRCGIWLGRSAPDAPHLRTAPDPRHPCPLHATQGVRRPASARSVRHLGAVPGCGIWMERWRVYPAPGGVGAWYPVSEWVVSPAGRRGGWMGGWVRGGWSVGG